MIAKVLEEQRRWKTVFNRRESFTFELHKEIAALPTIVIDSCCLDAAAITNWTLCNLYDGCRGIEWAQTSSSINRYLSTFHRNRFQLAYAFTLADVLCFNASSSPVSIPEALANPSLVGKIKLQFEEQKMARTESGSCSPETRPKLSSVLSKTLSKSLLVTKY